MGAEKIVPPVLVVIGGLGLTYRELTLRQLNRIEADEWLKRYDRDPAYNRARHRAASEEIQRRTGRSDFYDNFDDDDPTGTSGGGGRFTVIPGGKGGSSHEFSGLSPEDMLLYGVVIVCVLGGLYAVSKGALRA